MKKRKNGMMTLLGFLGTLQSSCVALIIGLLILIGMELGNHNTSLADFRVLVTKGCLTLQMTMMSSTTK